MDTNNQEKSMAVLLTEIRAESWCGDVTAGDEIFAKVAALAKIQAAVAEFKELQLPDSGEEKVSSALAQIEAGVTEIRTAFFLQSPDANQILTTVAATAKEQAERKMRKQLYRYSEILTARQYAEVYGIELKTVYKQAKEQKLQDRWRSRETSTGALEIYRAVEHNPFLPGQTIEAIAKEDNIGIVPIMNYLKAQHEGDALSACERFLWNPYFRDIADISRLRSALSHAVETASFGPPVKLCILIQADGIWRITSASDPALVVGYLPGLERAFAVIWQDEVEQKRQGVTPTVDSPYPRKWANQDIESLCGQSLSEIQQRCLHCLQKHEQPAGYCSDSCKESHRRWISDLAKLQENQLLERLIKRLNGLSVPT